MDNRPTQDLDQLIHSGSSAVPEEMRETPTVDFDNTSLEDAHNQNLIVTPDTTEGLVPVDDSRKPEIEDNRPNVARRVIIAVGGAAATAVVAFGAIFAVNTTQAPAPGPVPVADGDNAPDVDTPKDNESDQASQIEAIINNPDRVTPEEIAAMSADELKAFATITAEEAPTPEEYAKQFTKVYNAFINSGTTAEEFAPFDNAAKGEYEAAMGEKYDSIFQDSLHVSGLSSPGFNEVHSATLNGSQSSRTLESEVPFNVGIQYKELELLSGNPDSTAEPFTIKLTVDVAANFEESLVSKVTNEKDVLTTNSWEIAVVNNNGELEIAQLKDK